MERGQAGETTVGTKNAPFVIVVFVVAVVVVWTTRKRIS